MTNLANNEPFHSEPINEIMDEIPSWMTRWGIVIIFVTLLSMIVGSCLIKYPQTVRGSILMTISDTSMTGVMLVPSSDISKIKPMQEVIVSLAVSPSSEFGIIKGYVSEISEIIQSHKEGTFMYSVESVYNNDIDSVLQMRLSGFHKVDGQAEILIGEKSLIEYYPLHLRF